MSTARIVQAQLSLPGFASPAVLAPTSAQHRADPALRPQPKRGGADFWPTPACLIEALLQHVLPALPPGPVWECAAGDGRLARAIEATGRSVLATDKYPQPGAGERDFLRQLPPAPGLLAITNPPFHSIDRFLMRGLYLLDRGGIAGLVLLCRHDHLQAQSRAELFNRATLQVHCNWRPIWIEGTTTAPRWSFAWVAWLPACPRQLPIYLRRKPLTLLA
jgi:hypothetical protein